MDGDETGGKVKVVWAKSVVRYSAGILDWSDQKRRAMDVKTRKRLTMFGAFHKKGSVARLYMKRTDDRRGLICVYDGVKEEELGLLGYVKVIYKWMLKVVGEKQPEKAGKEVAWQLYEGCQ